LFTVLEKKIFKNHFPVGSFKKENDIMKYQACPIPGRNCFESKKEKV